MPLTSRMSAHRFRPGRWRLWLVLLPLLGLGSGGAGEAWQVDFDGQIPGQWPEKWRVDWGEKREDIFMIDNTSRLSGENSLLIDRATGKDFTHLKLIRTDLPDLDQGWACFSFAFRIEGPASRSEISFEIGDAHPRQVAKVVVGLRGWGPTVHLYPNCLPTWSDNWNGLRELGHYQTGRWNRVTLFLPTQGGGQKLGYGRLEVRQANGEWELVGREQIPCQARHYRQAIIYIPAKNDGFRLWVDDLRLTPAEPQPETGPLGTAPRK